eukprot:TRINITY_DN5315_c0_g6_i1.p1 TRINITY_DN5315_c0_g6~~TRINITY_DN5315_c0_g6_i1.p1  ORF type:complete len:1052 (+),score=400.87 TRINITY_DN5315_c0_g6_i1:2138-5293(+)
MTSLTQAKDKVVNAVSGINMNKIGLDNNSYFESNGKLEDLRKQLESDSDREKVEAMKKLMGMTSKGRDVSSLFPHVVKSVISKNVELKKMVYMFLVHYAEMEQDAALLAINSFQKDLGNSNQLIRAFALRVMSSIRVKIISQLIVIAIDKCCKDSSPYVRKTAAHAIPKVFNLDREQKEQCIKIIQILLGDRSTSVLGSAVAAFDEVCPDRFDLIHSHFRKLCLLLADIDEWGQCAILNLLLRYGRTQFTDPNKIIPKEPKAPKEPKLKTGFDEEEESEEEESEEESDDDFGDIREIDPDHRLLLNSALPLLKSRNSAVVMAVASLYHYLAPREEAHKVIKAVVRTIHSKKEIQFLVLSNIATWAAADRGMFEPFVEDFFVDPNDPAYVRNLKLEIITLLCNSDNINKILKEFKNYINREEKDFVTGTIQAIGRCASRVPEVTDRCLQGLMGLITNKADAVVAESVVVIKKLLQQLSEREKSADDDEEEDKINQDDTMKEIMIHLSQLLETITAPKARASIVWVIGEYSHKLPLLGPDILRKLAKGFGNEEPQVKLQIMSLGAKLFCTNPEQTARIYEYILSVAKYDNNYDVRDRGRVEKKLTFDNSGLKSYSARLLATKKPVPTEISAVDGRGKFRMGSLSHALNQTIAGYLPLEDFPEVAPPTDVRTEVIEQPKAFKPKYNWDTSEEEYETDEEGEEGEEGEEIYSEFESESEEVESGEEESDSEEEDFPPPKAKQNVPVKKAAVPAAPVKSGFDLDDIFGSLSPTPAMQPQPAVQAKPAAKPQLNLDDLFGGNSLPAPISAAKSNSNLNFGNSFSDLGFGAPQVRRETLLKHIVGGGLGVEYSYTRTPSMHGATMITIQLYFTNHIEKTIHNITMGKKSLSEGMEIIPFTDVPQLAPGTSTESSMAVKLSSVSQTIKFEITTDRGTYSVNIEPPAGELVRASSISPQEFNELESKFKGMEEASDTVQLTDMSEMSGLTQKVLKTAYLSIVDMDSSVGKFRFAGKSQIDDTPVIFSVNVESSGKAKLSLGSSNAILNSRLLKELKKNIV